MANFAGLRDAMNRHDVENFLRLYIKDIIDGVTFTLPISTHLPQACIEWEDAMPKECVGYNEQFIKDLASLWLSIVSKLDEDTTDVPQAALTLLTYGDATQPLESAEGPIKGLPLTGRNPKLDQVATHISADYYEQENAAKPDSYKPKSRRQALQDLMLTEKDKSFLIVYLGIIKNGKIPPVPKSTIIETIEDEWDKILHVRLKKEPSKTFIKKLAARWYYWTNRTGIPVTLEQFKALLVNIKTTEVEINPFDTDFKPNIIERFLNWLK